MNYTWTYAGLNDSAELLDLSLKVKFEVETIYDFNPNVLAHNIVMGLVNQYYTGFTDLFAITRNEENRIIGYTWAHSGDTTMFSNEKIVTIRMAHVDPDLSDRKKIMLIKDMMQIWERFAQITQTPIIASTTIRQKQSAFLRLHEKAGYIIRGTGAYKRVDLGIVPDKLFD